MPGLTVALVWFHGQFQFAGTTSQHAPWIRHLYSGLDAATLVCPQLLSSLWRILCPAEPPPRSR